MELLSVEALLSIAERFQTTLVGILGFVGVILTLLHNARETKRQNKRAINNEQASKHLRSTSRRARNLQRRTAYGQYGL